MDQSRNHDLGSEDDLYNPVWQDAQLSYIGKECTKIPIVLANVYGKLAKRLDLSFNELTTLTGVEEFTALEELILDNNELTDGAAFPGNVSLKTLSLNKNKFRNLEELLVSVKSSYPNLRYLSLLGNSACPDQLSGLDKDDDDYKRYRYYVIHKIPSLHFLDSTKISSEDRKEAARIGGYMRVVRPESDIAAETAYEDSIWQEFSPLPEDTPGETHRGAFGKLKYKYTGKHSEGNRFIRNHEL